MRSCPDIDSVWKCRKPLSFVFDMLHTSIIIKQTNGHNIACGLKHVDHLELIHSKKSLKHT